MGIVIKQTIKGTIWSYLGVAIGFVTTSYLYPKYLTPDVVGLFGLLISYSIILANFANLGMNGVTARLFTYFRNREKNHNGFLFVAFAFQLLGFLMVAILFNFYKANLIQSNIEKSFLFSEYVYLIVPLTLFTLLFIFLDVFNKVLYDAVLGTFLQEFLQRVLIFLFMLLYIFKVLDLNQLILAYALAVSLKGVILMFYLIFRKDIRVKPDFQLFQPDMKKEFFNVALFSILGGLGSMLVFNIDKILINHLMDLSNTGVYTIAFYFGTLVVIPSRPLLKISGTLIADAWKKEDLESIKTIYYKSCINQLIIGGFLFLGIWANIDNILQILGPDYAASKWVIFFIGLGYLFDMATGSNAQVIAYSKYYRVSLLFLLVLIGLVFSLIYLLVPVWGITGAAIAIASSLFLNNLLRYVFLKIKYKLQPFNIKFLWVLFLYGFIYLILIFIPQQNLFLDLVIRAGLITTLSFLFLLFIPISEDVKMLQLKMLDLIKAKLKG